MMFNILLSEAKRIAVQTILEFLAAGDTKEEIWDYAKENNLAIVSKDADVSNKIII